MPASIYTIGYGGRSVEALMQLLSTYSVECIVDVRSKPYSMRTPEFSRESLRNTLESSGLRYLFLGDLLGGRPNDASCYTDGKVNYTVLSDMPFYREGIARLEKALNLDLKVALLCSESKPHECHRSKLIGESLRRLEMKGWHIDETGQLRSQEQIMDRIGGNQPSLFDDMQPWQFSRKAYVAVDSDRDAE